MSADDSTLHLAMLPVKAIPLTQGQVAIVDPEDYDLVSRRKWCTAHRRGDRRYYAQTSVRVNGRKSILLMHTLLTGYSRTDHINGNGLDNRRRNLRPVTNAQNAWNASLSKNNTSGYKGVTYLPPGRNRRRTGKWLAQIKVSGKYFDLGRFTNPEDAARAYDRAAIQVFGDYARLNFPPDDQGHRRA